MQLPEAAVQELAVPATFPLRISPGQQLHDETESEQSPDPKATASAG